MTTSRNFLFSKQPTAMPRRPRRQTVAILALLALAAASAQAATYSVTTTADQADGSSSGGWALRDTVMAANADANASNVVALPAGTYTLSQGTAETNSWPNAAATAQGDIDITKDLTIEGAGAATTIINGADIDRAFDIHGANVTIRNVTITNCSAIGAGAPYGGAIYMRGVNSAGTGIGDKELRLENCIISSNAANHNGGAVAVSGWTGQTPNRLVMQNCTLQSNTSAYGGGALVVNATSNASVTGCTFSGNTASGTIGYGGGAICSMPGTASGAGTSLSDCTFTNNTASQLSGGALVHHNGSLSVTHCSFTSNSAQVNGGAISRSASDQTASVTLTGCNFTGNSAVTYGGAVFNRGPNSTVGMSFCRILNNTAGTDGGTGVANINVSGSGAGAFNAANNWWGENTGAAGTMVSGTVTVTPHLQLTLSSSSNPVRPGETATLTASLNRNSLGTLVGGTTPSHVHNLTPVSWSATGGSLAGGAPTTLSSGQAQASFTGGSYGEPRLVSATVDNQTTPLDIEAPVTVSGWNAE